jgi:diguanylate cyclase (GGDEF)-like protein
MRILPVTLGFRGRLVATMVVLVVLVSLAIGALFMAYLFEEERTRALTQLDIGERLTEEVMARRTNLELSRLSVVVQDFGFLSAIASGDRATMESALNNHSQRVDAAFAVLMNQDRQVLASNLAGALPELNNAMFESAIHQGYGRQWLALDGQGFELLLVPVQAPGLRAWMLAGFALGSQTAGVIARLSDTTVLFRARSGDRGDYQAFATSPGVNEAQQESLVQTVSGERYMDNPHYFTRVVPLSGRDNHLQALLLISRDASLQRYYQRAGEVAMLVLGILVAAALLALYLARSLGRPVLQLADYARAVGGDTPAEPPPVQGSGEIRQLNQAFTDMVRRLREREEQIRYTATHDDITGLGNRNALVQFTRSLFQEHRHCSVVGLRLDELSEINDSLGLELGDRVLVGMAKRLREAFTDAQLLARTGGDEFLALLPPLSSGQLEQRALAAAAQLRKPLLLDSTPFSLRISVVTLELPEDAANANEFRRRLNLTFEKASDHPDTVMRYQPGEDESHLRELQLIADLHAAITGDGLIMHYQPKLDLATGQLVQVEALVRWRHPDLGQISPEEFIFLAERSGQIHDLTAHILTLVARDARQWQSQGLDLGVAINLSALDLAWRGLTEHIAHCFRTDEGDVGHLTLEVTEGAVMEDPENAMVVLNDLRSLGALISVDDFGTGYSSLSQLRRLPVGELKIDKSFVLNLTNEPQDQLIVKSTIDMAHGLGLTVVAEGIESLDTWALLQSWHCDLGQGFALSRPVPAAELPKVAEELRARRPRLMTHPTETLS